MGVIRILSQAKTSDFLIRYARKKVIYLHDTTNVGERISQFVEFGILLILTDSFVHPAFNHELIPQFIYYGVSVIIFQLIHVSLKS